ncbi:MAG: hypothetical protein U0W24_05880 [Bacteroidales bacterium]
MKELSEIVFVKGKESVIAGLLLMIIIAILVLPFLIILLLKWVFRILKSFSEASRVPVLPGVQVEKLRL